MSPLPDLEDGDGTPQLWPLCVWQPGFTPSPSALRSSTGVFRVRLGSEVLDAGWVWAWPFPPSGCDSLGPSPAVTWAGT